MRYYKLRPTKLNDGKLAVGYCHQKLGMRIDEQASEVSRLKWPSELLFLKLLNYYSLLNDQIV